MIFAALKAPADYEDRLAKGRAEPLPWYLGYIRAGQYLNCPPWELVDAWTPREFWRRAALIVANAEADAREYRDHLERMKREAKRRSDEMKQRH